MELTLFQQILLWAFVIAGVMSMVVCKTNFCTMGAVSDWVNMQDTGRMRAWLLAIAVAILGIALLDNTGHVDMSLADNGETGKPPYGSPQFVWLRYILGGLLFGIGMTYGSGCGNKTCVRIGGGNLKSIIVFLAMGVGAYLMIYTNFGFNVFFRWMPVVDLTAYGLSSQGIDDIMMGLTGFTALSYIVPLVIGILFLWWVFSNAEFRSSFDNILGGITVGLAIVSAWYVSAGPLGQTLLGELDFLDTVPYDVGAQSFTFVKPTAQFYYWIENGFSPSVVSFALVAVTGVIIGSFIYSLVTGKLRIEWFVDVHDWIRHIIGGLLMGVGGVMSLGCTFGQAITGASTLALGSFITFIFIVLGSACTMKIQYYQMLYEKEATLGKVLITVLADFHIVPNSLRKLDDI